MSALSEGLSLAAAVVDAAAAVAGPVAPVFAAVAAGTRLAALIAAAGSDPVVELRRIRDTWTIGLAAIEAREQDRLAALRRATEPDPYEDP